MADEADITGERMAFEAAMLQKESATRVKAERKSSKVCLNCGEYTEDGARWCDSECRDDWSMRGGDCNGSN